MERPPTHTQVNTWVYEEEENTHGNMKPQNTRDKEKSPNISRTFSQEWEYVAMEI